MRQSLSKHVVRNAPKFSEQIFYRGITGVAFVYFFPSTRTLALPLILRLNKKDIRYTQWMPKIAEQRPFISIIFYCPAVFLEMERLSSLRLLGTLMAGWMQQWDK